jgi:hypothetical protein
VLHSDTIRITPAILTLIARNDEFKGAWGALGTLAPERLSAPCCFASPTRISFGPFDFVSVVLSFAFAAKGMGWHEIRKLPIRGLAETMPSIVTLSFSLVKESGFPLTNGDV